jgi:hypothetical protein
MVFQNFSIFQFANRSSSNLIIGLSTLFLMGLCLTCLPAVASATRFSLELSVDTPIEQLELTQQAESLIRQTITQAFSQNPALNSVEVTVNVNRNGDILPLMTAIVSRSQWQTMPQVSQWSKRYLTYQQFQRPQSIARSTANPMAASRRSQSGNWQAVTFAIDRARDRGELSGETAQQYLNHLD